MLLQDSRKPKAIQKLKKMDSDNLRSLEGQVQEKRAVIKLIREAKQAYRDASPRNVRKVAEKLNKYSRVDGVDENKLDLKDEVISQVK